MEFRPCIDIHNGRVKQIVGGSLRDENNQAEENFVAEQDAAFFAGIYRDAGIRGGHIILLNAADSEYYEATRQQAFAALGAFPQGMQVGGGITPKNAEEYLTAGASHVIVTSYVFKDGIIHLDRLKKLVETVGRKHLVLDVSCRRRGDEYYVVTDRWQKLTTEKLDIALLERLSEYCDEFLIHAVDVEGRADGIETRLAEELGKWEGIPITYAGGVHSYEDVELLKRLGKDRLNVTIGSALDLFGGALEWKRIAALCGRTSEAVELLIREKQ